MTTMKISTIVVAAIVLMISYDVSAQAPGPAPMAAFGPSAEAPMVPFGPSAEAPTDDCLTKLLNMSDCLSYVTTGSNVTTPDKACCPELAGLVESSPICLCELLSNSSSSGFNIDLNKALKLPSVCGVSTPSVSLCAVLGVPVGVPSPSEESMSPGAHSPGVAASPTTGDKNGACNITGSSLAFLVGLAIAFLSTFF